MNVHLRVWIPVVTFAVKVDHPFWPLVEFMTVLSIENSNLSLQFVSTGHVSVLKSKDTAPFWNCFVIENPKSEFDW